MIAIDTNALLRLVLEDPPAHADAVHALLLENRVLIPLTVMLEAEWALRSGYKFGKVEVLDALEQLAALPQVVVEHSSRVDVALAWSREGMDFADALHLAGADGCDALATLDRALSRKAKSLGVPPVRLLA